MRENAGFGSPTGRDHRRDAQGARVLDRRLRRRVSTTRFAIRTTPGFDVYEEMYRQSEQPEDFQIQQASAEEVVRAPWNGTSPERAIRECCGPVYDPHAPTIRLRNGAPVFRRPLPRRVAYTDASLAPLLERLFDPASAAPRGHRGSREARGTMES